MVILPIAFCFLNKADFNFMKKIFLKPGRDASVRRFHPWVFSGGVKHIKESISDGETVEIYSHENQYLATGHFQQGSILVRIISFEKTVIDQDFWISKIKNAYDFRREIGNLQDNDTNCYRLIHAEGDGLPGLIVDVYGKTAVIQCHSIGMHFERMKIAQALLEIYENKLKAIYDKSAAALPSKYGTTIENSYLFGHLDNQTVTEYGHQFFVDWESGQKTGFFLDQRENRNLLKNYVSDKSVLNAFCYSGGFSIYALKAGAKLVHSVDISQKAIDWTNQNVSLNGNFKWTHEAFTADVLKFLQATEATYEVIVVDPPAFAKSKAKRHNAVQAYKRLNALALKKIAPNGILFTFSCSQVVDESLFYNTITAAAIEAKRKVRVIQKLSQPADHPVSLFHPEGAYLKGLVLFVE